MVALGSGQDTWIVGLAAPIFLAQQLVLAQRAWAAESPGIAALSQRGWWPVAGLLLCVVGLALVVLRLRSRLAVERARSGQAAADQASVQESSRQALQLANGRAEAMRVLLRTCAAPEPPASIHAVAEAMLRALTLACPDCDAGLVREGEDLPSGPGVALQPLCCHCELAGTLWLRRRDGLAPTGEHRQILADCAGPFVGMCDQAQDRERRRRLLDTLRSLEMQSRQLLDFIPVPVWVISIDTLHFVRVNEAAVGRYGYSRSEWLTMTVADIRPPEDIPFMHEVFGKIRSEDRVQTHTCRHRTKSGEVIWVDLITRPAPFFAPGAYLSISFDVTPREMERRALANRSSELVKANEQLDRFATIAGHDLKEPLRMIASFSELLEARLGDRLTEKERTYFEFIKDGATRMRRLLDDLLQYSKAGSRALRVAPVDAGESLRLAMANLRLEIDRVAANIECGPMPRVAADESLLQMVFQNLISNSLRHRGEAPVRITIDAERTGDLWRFCVMDNGRGIAPELRREAFDMFRRGVSGPDSPRGSGLGLSICQRIISRLGGMIWLDVGDHGRGLRAMFTLPAVSDDAAPGPEQPPRIAEVKNIGAAIAPASELLEGST